MWHTRNITPKGKYYLYAVVTSGGTSYIGTNKPVVNLLEDTTPPPAPTALGGVVENGHYKLSWLNPTHLVHLDELLTDYSTGIAPMESVNEDGATMSLSISDGALKCDYTLTKEWATAAAEYVFAQPTDMHETPFLTFRLKGNGSATDLRIVCKNMSANHEDRWYTESVNLSQNTWKEINLDLSGLKAFDWYTNTDDRNQCEGIVRLSFAVSTGSAVNGTFWLDDLHLTGDIYPAPDYKETVIVRKANAFSTSPSDGTEIYRGTAESCSDASSVAGLLYYYTAFAFDDRNNWSNPSTAAQWKSTDNTSVLDAPHNNTSAPQKFLRNGHLVIQRDTKIYTALGTIAE